MTQSCNIDSFHLDLVFYSHFCLTDSEHAENFLSGFDSFTFCQLNSTASMEFV